MQGNITDQNKIVHLMCLLMGIALTWATAIWEKEGETVSNYEHFVSVTLSV